MLCCKHSWWSFCYPLIPSGDYSKGIILLSGEYWSYHRSPPTHLDPWSYHLQYLLYWYCYWIYNHPSTYLPWAEIITSRCKAAFFATKSSSSSYWSTIMASHLYWCKVIYFASTSGEKENICSEQNCLKMNFERFLCWVKTYFVSLIPPLVSLISSD